MAPTLPLMARPVRRILRRLARALQCLATARRPGRLPDARSLPRYLRRDIGLDP